MLSILYIIFVGFLVRADGWGTEDKRWKKVSDVLNIWTCAILFGLLCLTITDAISAIACVGAFIIWRLPGFDGWQNYKEMYWRGLWTTAIGFTLVALTVHTSFSGLLSIPFAAIYAAIYTGGYKYLPETILGFNRHVWIEHASGWAFCACILTILLTSCL